jgi:hypothetical protein
VRSPAQQTQNNVSRHNESVGELLRQKFLNSVAQAQEPAAIAQALHNAIDGIRREWRSVVNTKGEAGS